MDAIDFLRKEYSVDEGQALVDAVGTNIKLDHVMRLMERYHQYKKEEETGQSDILVMSKMAKDNMDISASPEILNLQRNKKGGKVTVGVANPQFDYLINQAATGIITHYHLLFIINKKQFDQLRKSEDEKHSNE